MKYAPSRRLIAGVMGLAVAAGVAGVATSGPAPDAATASSHREAPLIAEDPSADNTDLYAFRDKVPGPGRSGHQGAAEQGADLRRTA